MRKNERKTVDALCLIDPSGGKVFVEGEYWSANSDTFVKKGEPVQIIAVEGLTTKVKPKPEEEIPCSKNPQDWSSG